MKIRVTFKHFASANKSIKYKDGKAKYFCNNHRLPKFIWERL